MNLTRIISATVLIVFCSLPGIAQNASLITNGNMEGEAGIKKVPPGWEIISATPDHCESGPTTCMELTHKIEKNSPQGGKWIRFFHGFLTSSYGVPGGGTLNNEIFGQQLREPLIAGKTYTLFFYAAMSKLNENSHPSQARILIGFSHGKPDTIGEHLQQAVLLYQPEQWRHYQLTFVATDDYDYISFGKQYEDLNNACYLDGVELSDCYIPRNLLASNPVNCKSDTTMLEVNSLAGRYEWSTGATQRSIAVTRPGTYWVKVTGSTCTRYDTVNINFNVCGGKVHMPNIFTPNADGRNDLLKPLETENALKVNLSIYNRWGRKLYETSDMRSGWNGSHEGEECAPGTYFYVAQIISNTGDITYDKGSFALMR